MKIKKEVFLEPEVVDYLREITGNQISKWIRKAVDEKIDRDGIQEEIINK